MIQLSERMHSNTKNNIFKFNVVSSRRVTTSFLRSGSLSFH